MSQGFRPMGFGGLPPVTKYILGINIILFVMKLMFRDRIPLDQYLDLYYYKAEYFRPYQFITHLFMHGSFFHIFFNMFGLYTFGSILEQIWGSKRFLNFYVLCGLGSAAAQYANFYYTDAQISEWVSQGLIDGAYYQEILNHMACLGASGALFGLLGAFAFLFPNTMLSVFFFPPMKAKYFVAIYAGIELLSGLINVAGIYRDGIAHFAHLGGLVVGLIIVFIWRKRGKNFY